jgi:ADP-heptose:LPS heptosyltransferase
MDLSENVKERVLDYRARLELINLAMAKEMDKACDQRPIELLRFLHMEKEVCSLTLVELEALLHDPNGQKGADAFPALKIEPVNDRVNPSENGHPPAIQAKRIHRIITWGGIGDVLLITPSIRALKQREPGCKIHVYCMSKSHKEVLINNKYIDRLLYVGPLGAIYHLLIPSIKSKFRWPNYGMLSPSLFYRENASAVIGEMLGIKVDDSRPDCFLTEAEERVARKIVSAYSNPVALHATAKSSPNKNWPAENWEKLVSNNSNYSFLQLGLANEELVQGAIDFRGTSLRQAFGIIKAAGAFVGVDSVFAHAATAFQVSAVVLFGASTPAIWGHTANINLYNPPRCSPCIDLLGGQLCPHGRACMSNITVSDVERALSSLLAPP